MKTPDDIDRKLIALLQDNARLSAVQLAKAVGLSRSAVRESKFMAMPAEGEADTMRARARRSQPGTMPVIPARARA